MPKKAKFEFPLIPPACRSYVSLTQIQEAMDWNEPFRTADGEPVTRKMLREAGLRKVTVRFGDKLGTVAL